MSRVAQYNWLPQDVSAIALPQTLAGAGNLILNGTLSIYGNPVVTLFGMNRKISLSSTANLSGRNFTITGTYLGNVQKATIAGPNNNSVQTAVYFNTITSVSVNGAVATNVSVGTGGDGHTTLYQVDEQSSIQAISAQVNVTSGTSITYAFVSTLQPMDANFFVGDGFNTIYNMNNTTASAIGVHGMLPVVANGAGAPTYNIPVYGHLPILFCWIDVTETLGQTGAFYAYILQQGIQ